jgi:hypothetical protein
MRADMFKVIVERPRLIHGNWLGGGREVGFRQFIASEERPRKMGIRAGHVNRKWPNENLAPLRRFLMSNAGRPWDKVRAELLLHVDQRNAVQQHILAHVDNYVEREVRATPRKNGKGVAIEYRCRWPLGWANVEESRAPLFVDPRTGILRLTHSSEKRAAKRRADEARRQAEAANVLRKLDDGTELRCFNDVWYEVRFNEVPGDKLHEWQKQGLKPDARAKLVRVFDILEKRWVSRFDADCYVIKKRQLSSKEIVKHRLRG